MTAGTAANERGPELLGQTVVAIGGSSGIGLETARRAPAEGAEVTLAGRPAAGGTAGRRRRERRAHL
jgi:NAD(P)-dependent dehydrogenase (short-subunit alcohol dehydrogenase family)